MRDFLKRVLLSLSTGYILLYYGELVFWATPEREGMSLFEIAFTWIVYSVFAYVFLCVVSLFRVHNVWAMFLAGAFYGWYEEGIFVQTMYGSPDGPFPVSISFTGLAWHALISVMVGWYLLRKTLAQGSALQVVALAAGIGAFFGLWGIWWWNQPPEPMAQLLNSGQKAVLWSRFSVFALSSTAAVVLAYGLQHRLAPFGFRPGRAELWVMGIVTLAYYAFVTVPAAPKALWVLPPLMGITLAALNRNRRLETRPDAISAFDGQVGPEKWLALFLIPLVAMAIYAVGLAVDARLSTNLWVYYAFSPLGAILWIASVVILFMKKGDPTKEKVAPESSAALCSQ